jgi:hypothetical protein
MKNLFFCMVAAVIILSSCGGGKMSPEAYNEKIVRMHSNGLDYLNSRMETIFEHEISKEDALKVVDSLSVKYDGYVKELKSLKIPDGAEDWNNACIQLFEYTRDSVITLYGETLNFEPETQEWYNVWNEIDHRMQGRASQINSNLVRAQGKFAATSGYKIR